MRCLLFLIFSTSSAFAGGFSFTPKKSILDGRVEIIKAQLSINGAYHSCLVDTGARFSIAKEHILKDLSKVGETIGGGISNIQNITDLVQTDLKLGDWVIESAVIGRTDRIPFDCLVGNEFFLDKTFTIDFSKNRFEEVVARPDTTFPLNVYKSDRGGHFGFNVNIAGHAVASLFDTGASQTVVDLKYVKENLKHFRLIKETQVQDGNSADIKAGIYRLDDIEFGSIHLKNIDIYALDLGNLQQKLPDLKVVIGLNIIQDSTWYFDTITQVWTTIP